MAAVTFDMLHWDRYGYVDPRVHRDERDSLPDEPNSNITIWRDVAENRMVVRTTQGVMLNEHGNPADIGPDHHGPERWTTVTEALAHFVKVDRILRSL